MYIILLFGLLTNVDYLEFRYYAIIAFIGIRNTFSPI